MSDDNSKYQMVEIDYWYRIHHMLNESKENSLELLNIHIESNGIESKKDKFIVDMYEKEIRELSDLINYTSKNNGVPF